MDDMTVSKMGECSVDIAAPSPWDLEPVLPIDLRSIDGTTSKNISVSHKTASAPAILPSTSSENAEDDGKPSFEETSPYSRQQLRTGQHRVSASFTRSKVLCKGALMCRSRKVRMLWREHYFSLQGGTIEEFKSFNTYMQRKPPIYRGEVVSTKVWPGKDFGFHFRTSDDKEHYVFAKTRYDFMRWLNSLTGASKDYQDEIKRSVSEATEPSPSSDASTPGSAKHVGFASEVEVYQVAPIEAEAAKSVYYSQAELTALLMKNQHALLRLKRF